MTRKEVLRIKKEWFYTTLVKEWEVKKAQLKWWIYQSKYYLTWYLQIVKVKDDDYFVIKSFKL